MHLFMTVKKKKLGSVCEKEDLCLDENAICEDGHCRCLLPFYHAVLEPVCSESKYHLIFVVWFKLDLLSYSIDKAHFISSQLSFISE